MKLNYILSSTTKAATSSALKQLALKAENDVFGKYIVIVPETKSVIIEQELLNLSKNGAFANIFVYSFVRLVNRMGFILPEKIVTKQACVILLRKIIFDNASKLKCYKKTAKTIGFAEKIYETIAQFKSSGVSADDLEHSMASKSEALKAKLEDIILLYKEYEKAFSVGLFDDLDKLAMLSNFAKTSEFVAGAEIYVVGFDNITFEMQKVLKDFATHAKEITFSSVYFAENRRDKFIQSNELYKKYKHIADELKFPYTPTFANDYKSGDFYNIANNLFSPEKKTFKSKGNIKVFEAISENQEIEFIAQTILKEIQEGKRYRDIGVFCSNLESESELIEKIFENYDIPYYTKKQYNLLNHFYLKFIQSAFSVKTTRLSPESVLGFVSNILFDADDYSTFSNFVFETGFNYKAFLNPLDEKYQSREDFAKISAVIEKFRKFYLLFDEKLSTSKSVSDFAGAIKFLNEYFDVETKLEQISNFEKEEGLSVESEITSKIFEQVENFEKSLLTFMNEASVSLEEFVQIYFSGFGSIKLNLSPSTIDSVIIADSTDAFLNIKDLFISHAVEGSFPAKIQDSGIIQDSELEEAKSLLNKDIEPTTKQINTRENFRVYEALLEPSEKLFVCFSSKNHDGSLSKPSRIVQKLISMFGDEIKIKDFEEIEYVNNKSFEIKFARDIGRFLGNKITLDELKREYSLIKKNLGETFRVYLENLCSSQPDFVIENANELYFFGNKTSISQLEKYFDCPYKFFASYGLRLQENKSVKASSLEIGNIIHRVAELFTKNINEFENLNSLEFDTKVKDLLQKTLVELEINENKNKALIKILSEECVRLCKYMFYERQNSGFKANPNRAEFSFSGENAVVLELNGRTLKIEGKIDRIDEFGDYIRVVDYKTGNVKSELSAVYFGTKIQLVSYLLAAQQIDGKKVAGIFYLPVHSDFGTSEKAISNMYKLDGFLLDDIDVIKNMDYTLSFEKNTSDFVPLKIKTSKQNVNENRFEISGTSNKFMSKKEFETLKKYTKNLCEKAADEILSGYIEPSPISDPNDDTPKSCKYCEFVGFCDLKNSRFSTGRTLATTMKISDFEETQKGDE